MIADSSEDISYTGVEGVKALMVEDEAIGLMWWTAEGDEAVEEADEVEKNPFRRWADEEVDEDRDGLGQGGIRPDPQRQEESRKTKKNTKVHTPTREEVEDHERHHCPFRAWCRHCVKGRGVNAQHRKKAEAEAEEESVGGGKVPRVSIDYFSSALKMKKPKIIP